MPSYKPTQEEMDEIERRFTYHKVHGDQPSRYVEIREEAKAFALLIHEQCPMCRERSLALTHLDEVVMFANAAIARRESPPVPANS